MSSLEIFCLPYGIIFLFTKIFEISFLWKNSSSICSSIGLTKIPTDFSFSFDILISSGLLTKSFLEDSFIEFISEISRLNLSANFNPKDNFELRIQAIYSDILDILGEFQPEVMAMEEIHSRYEYPKTAIVMGHVRGAICLAAAQTGIPVVGYTATRVKSAITGSGASPKKQVQRAVAAQLKLDEIPSPNDVADAFALAICHAMSASRVIAAID